MIRHHYLIDPDEIEMMDIELDESFVQIEGNYKKRKIWRNTTTLTSASGVTTAADEESNGKAAGKQNTLEDFRVKSKIPKWVGKLSKRRIPNTETQSKFDLEVEWRRLNPGRSRLSVVFMNKNERLLHAEKQGSEMGQLIRKAAEEESVPHVELARQAVQFVDKHIKSKSTTWYWSPSTAGLRHHDSLLCGTICSHIFLLQATKSYQLPCGRRIARETIMALIKGFGFLPSFIYDLNCAQRFHHYTVRGIDHPKTLSFMLRDYVLRAMAGYRLKEPLRKRLDKHTGPYYFLDEPVSDPIWTSSYNNFHTFNVPLGMAIYQINLESVVIKLLSYGARPDLELLLPMVFIYLKSDTDEQRSHQAASLHKYLHYFCRARRSLQVELVSNDDARELYHVIMAFAFRHEVPDTPMLIQEGLFYWPISGKLHRIPDLLFWPRDLEHMLPIEMIRRPATLKHQCRMRVRQAVLDADQLPRGLYKLSLPKYIRDYLRLIHD